MGIRHLWSSFKSLTLCQLCLAIICLTSGFIINIIQASLYLTVRPFNAKLYRKINYYITYALHGQISFIVEWWSGSDTVLFTDRSILQSYFGKEHAFIVMNHGCEVAWIIGGFISERVGVLGNIKAYTKMKNKYMPVLGWSWKLQEYVFLERDWEKDKKALPSQLSNLSDYPDPVWLYILPEGTRLNKEKYDESMEVARKKGLPILKHHLLPRTKGFATSVPHLKKGKFKAIYDMTIVVDKGCVNEPSLLSLMKGKEVKTMAMVRRIPIEEVPNDEEGAAQWLHKLFQEKDKLVDNHLSTGEFVLKEERSKEEYQAYKDFECLQLKRRPYSLIVYIFWTIVVLFPLGSYALRTFYSGSLFASASVMIVVGSFYFALNCAFNMSETTSSYGNTKTSENEKNVPNK